MSVVVRGMRMPESCDVCRFGDWSNLHQTACCKLKDYRPCFSDYSREFKTQRSTICPLVEIPEKHGRLIDADKLMDDIKKNSASYFADDFAREWVDVQPTVIESEDGK